MMFLLEVILLVGLPYGTAILFGALAERLAGSIVSAWSSFGGLALGIYFVHRAFEIMLAS